MTEVWFRSMIDKPIPHFNQQRGCDRIKRRLRENGNAPIVLSDNTGFWTTKMPWVGHIVGSTNFLPVLVVRDPRSWIHMLLSQENRDRYAISIFSVVLVVLCCFPPLWSGTPESLGVTRSRMCYFLLQSDTSEFTARITATLRTPPVLSAKQESNEYQCSHRWFDAVENRT